MSDLDYDEFDDYISDEEYYGNINYYGDIVAKATCNDDLIELIKQSSVDFVESFDAFRE